MSYSLSERVLLVLDGFVPWETTLETGIRTLYDGRQRDGHVILISENRVLGRDEIIDVVQRNDFPWENGWTSP